jgi:hypothetical protein
MKATPQDRRSAATPPTQIYSAVVVCWWELPRYAKNTGQFFYFLTNVVQKVLARWELPCRKIVGQDSFLQLCHPWAILAGVLRSNPQKKEQQQKTRKKWLDLVGELLFKRIMSVSPRFGCKQPSLNDMFSVTAAGQRNTTALWRCQLKIR